MKYLLLLEIIIFLSVIPVTDVKAAEPTAVTINEVFPNPDSGAEWVELACSDEALQNHLDLTDYSLHDAVHTLVTLNGVHCTQSFFVVEVTGLNNDGDSVILYDAMSQKIDEMSYATSLKGQSWLRLLNSETTFILGLPSKGQENIFPTATPTPTPTLQPTPTYAPTLTVTTIPSPPPVSTDTTLAISSALSSPTQTLTPTWSLDPTFQYEFDPQHYKLDASQDLTFDHNHRLVFIQESLHYKILLNAIMSTIFQWGTAGSFLYVTKKLAALHSEKS